MAKKGGQAGRPKRTARAEPAARRVDRGGAAETTIETDAASQRDARPQGRDFPIVGIGASAGGLAAFEAFFSHVPVDPDQGIAYVIVQHLDPDHKSILTELIRRYTRMNVFEVTDGMALQPNCTYIIPPNKDLALLNGSLHLLDPVMPRGRRLPIDFFFRSLAQDRGEQAVCIVLSGNGTDGTLGLRAVKETGGMAMVQDPATAEYDGMPRSALSTGLADYVLAPEVMPGQLLAFKKHSLNRRPAEPAASMAGDASDGVQKIMVLLRAHTKHEFSQYKQNTVRRRVERRIAVNQVESIEKYAQMLGRDPRELEILFRELLIGVTGFFRDPEAFDALRERVLPQLLDNRPAGSTFRVWAAGCSTGEEAYSLAILLHEESERLRKDFSVQIYATDIDSFAVEKARVGLYPASIAADVSAERLSHFFVPEQEDFYRIRKSIRDVVIFAEQNMIKDPPFSRLDLISCRNVLIYMEPVLQKKVLSTFHYALNPGGFLLLGASESIGESTALFTTSDRKWRIYRRKDVGGTGRMPAELSPPLLATTGASGRVEAKGRPPGIREVSERALLRDYAPTSVTVNDRGDILYIHGRTGKYLEIPPGEASVNLVRSAREGLKLHLSSALRKAATQRAVVRHDGLTVKTNGDTEKVNLVVRPAEGAGEPSGLLLVVFEEPAKEGALPPAPPASLPAGEPGAESPEHRQIEILERELALKEETLQRTVEELETSNEELKSTNEELQSTNEELQSANEELETSKEELQSVNEELITVNTELQQKLESLSRANNDMNNLLAGTGIGTVFVDQKLRIRRFTPAATKIINLIKSDIGRPLSDIALNIPGSERLQADVKGVLDTLVQREAEVQTRDGQWYLLRILPYRTTENVIEGAVITFVEITELKRLHETLNQSDKWLRMALGVSGIRGWTYDLSSGRVSHPLPGGTGGQDYLSLEDFSSVIHPEDRVRVLSAMENAIATGAELRTEFRVVERGKDRWLLSRGTVSRDAEGRPTALIGIDVDITETRSAGK